MIYHAYYPQERGAIQIGYRDGVVLLIAYADRVGEKNERSAFSDQAYRQIDEYLKGKRKAFDFPFLAQGSGFQEKVWDALCRIPYGQTRSYGQIAREIGAPNACRAVGMACRENPIALVIPCHRVVGSGGKLTGYAGGLDRKEFLLALEKRYS